MKRNVREIGPGKLGLIARDRLGDAVCLVVKDECEQVVSSFAAAVAALVDEDAELCVSSRLRFSKEQNIFHKT